MKDTSNTRVFADLMAAPSFLQASPAAIESSCHQHPSFIQRRHCTAGAADCHGGTRGEGHAAGVQDPGENPIKCHTYSGSKWFKHM